MKLGTFPHLIIFMTILFIVYDTYNKLHKVRTNEHFEFKEHQPHTFRECIPNRYILIDRSLVPYDNIVSLHRQLPEAILILKEYQGNQEKMAMDVRRLVQSNGEGQYMYIHQPVPNEYILTFKTNMLTEFCSIGHTKDIQETTKFNTTPNTDDYMFIIYLLKRREHILKKVVPTFPKDKTIVLYPGFPKYKLYSTQLQKELISRNLIHRNSKFLESIRNKNKHANAYSGKIACHLSHCLVAQMYLNMKTSGTCAIFEDDIVVHPKIKITNGSQYYINVASNILMKDKGIDIVFLGMCWEECAKMKLDKKYNNAEYNLKDVKIFEAYRPLCRHAYMLNNPGAHKMLKYLLPMQNYPGDNLLSRTIKFKQISARSMVPQIYIQNRNEMGTNLGNNGYHVPICKIYHK